MDAVDKLDGPLENALVVGIETEHKTALDRDAVVVQPFDHVGIFARLVELFLHAIERGLADGLEPDQQSAATALGGQSQ